jgi:Ca-activated chloride channel homolog
MKARLIVTIVIALGVASADALSRRSVANAEQQATFRGASESVRVFVTVLDHDGRLVPNLKQDAFEVRDEGKPQMITVFDNTPQPIRLITMLDVSGSMEGNLPLLRGAADALFKRMRPDDQMRIGSFGHDVVISSSFTSNPDELRSALPRAIAPDAPTPLWRALAQATDAFKGAKEERSVILVLSDGKDSGPIGFKEKYVSQAEVIDHARSEDVMVYAIGMRSRAARPTMPGLGPGGLQAALMADQPDPGLAKVAQETGGGFAEIRFGQDLGQAFAQVADELHAQYLIGYTPPKRDGKVHNIEVRVNQSGLKARARKSYVAPK